MKLKTLEDLYFAEMEKMGMEPVVQVGRLKKEAIKWRKNINLQVWEEWFCEFFHKKTTQTSFGEWLLDKIFNITESDLKQSKGGKE